MDVAISTVGSGIDLLNDTIGFALILWAVSLLARQPGTDAYSSRLRLLGGLTLAYLVWSVIVQVAPDLGPGPIGLVFSGVAVAAWIIFCTSMRDLCAFHGLPRSLDRWEWARKLVTILIGIGWLMSFVVYVVRAIDQGTLSPPQVILDISGPVVLLVLLILVVTFVPVLFVLVAILSLFAELRTATEPLPG